MTGFLRRNWNRTAKLGKGRKKKQKWKRPTGRHNKMREKRRGKPATVSIGYKTNSEIRGKIDEKKTIFVKNIKDLQKADKKTVVILGNIGMKKKIEIIKTAKEKGIQILRINAEKFLSREVKNEPKK